MATSRAHQGSASAHGEWWDKRYAAAVATVGEACHFSLRTSARASRDRFRPAAPAKLYSRTPLSLPSLTALSRRHTDHPPGSGAGRSSLEMHPGREQATGVLLRLSTPAPNRHHPQQHGRGQQGVGIYLSDLTRLAHAILGARLRHNARTPSGRCSNTTVRSATDGDRNGRGLLTGGGQTSRRFNTVEAIRTGSSLQRAAAVAPRPFQAIAR